MMKIKILSALLLLGSIQYLYAQNKTYESYSFVPKCPDEIFVGAILESKSLNADTYQFVNVPLNPIMISYSMASKSQEIVPSAENMKKSVYKAVQEIGTLKQYSFSSYGIGEWESEETLAFKMGQTVDYSTYFARPSTLKKKQTAVIVNITLGYFQVFMDIPEKLCADAEALKAYNIDDLIYISSISYGRKATLTVESDYNYLDVRRAIEYMMNKAKGENTAIDNRLESIFMNSTIRIMVVGGKKIDDSDPNNPLKGLVEYLNKKVTSDDFGVPIEFSASHLKDNGAFFNQFSIR